MSSSLLCVLLLMLYFQMLFYHEGHEEHEVKTYVLFNFLTTEAQRLGGEMV